MVVPHPIAKPTPKQDPLVRILAEMVESALRWEAEHPSELKSLESRLTEAPDVINLNHTDLLLADAHLQSPPEGDTNVPA